MGQVVQAGFTESPMVYKPDTAALRNQTAKVYYLYTKRPLTDVQFDMSAWPETAPPYYPKSFWRVRIASKEKLFWEYYFKSLRLETQKLKADKS